MKTLCLEKKTQTGALVYSDLPHSTVFVLNEDDQIPFEIPTVEGPQLWSENHVALAR